MMAADHEKDEAPANEPLDSGVESSGEIPTPEKQRSSFSWWSPTGSGHSAQAGDSANQVSKVEDLRQTMINEAVSCNVDLVERCPARIVVILSLPPQADDEDDADGSTKFAAERLGLTFSQDPEDHSILISSIHSPLVLKNPLSQYGEGDLLHVGDELLAMNGTSLEGLSMEEVNVHCQSLSGDVCLVFRPQGEICEGLCQLVIVERQPEETNDAGERSAFPALGLQLIKRRKMLQIQSISPECILTRSNARVIEPGDYCVALARTPCAILEPDDASAVLQAQMEHSVGCISILTIQASDSEKRWNKIRRAAVAVGGGTMVGVGSVLMVTPLHPVGHAMAIGGVGVLGTEFEAPKRAIKAATERFQRKSKSSDEPCSEKEVDDEAGDDTSDSSSELLPEGAQESIAC